MILTANFGTSGLNDVTYQFFDGAERLIGSPSSTGITQGNAGWYSADVIVPAGAVGVRWSSVTFGSSLVSYELAPVAQAETARAAEPAPVKKFPVLVPPERQGIIDVQDVRDFVWDRTIADNVMDLDLTFSDQEITNAMRFAAMKYNEMPPLVDTVNPASLKFGMIFLNGIAACLYLSKLQQEARKDIQYTSGNLTVDLYQRRLAHLKEFAAVFKTDFEQQAKAMKISINTNLFYRAY